MKKQVLYIHGGDAFSRQEDFLHYLQTVAIRNLPESETKVIWSSTLAEDLGAQYEVFTPTMPNKQNASYVEWSIWFKRHCSFLRDGAILVGWSLGGMFLAKFLAEEEVSFVPGKVFLLAAPCGSYDDDLGNDCGSFQFKIEVLNRLRTAGFSLEIWHSTDDFVVPFSAANAYATALPEAKTRFFSDKNHFLVPTLPELLTEIKACSK